MTLYAILKLLHVLAAMWLVSGLLGRAVALSAARRAPDMPILKAIADVSGRLENVMIAPGYLAVLVTGVATAVAGEYRLFGPFDGGPLWIFLPLLSFALLIALTPLVLREDARWGRALDDSARAGAISAVLRTFLDRRAMLRRYAPDIGLVAAIVVLMVLKPF
jgi:uncharacterized membrane protein